MPTPVSAKVLYHQSRKGWSRSSVPIIILSRASTEKLAIVRVDMMELYQKIAQMKCVNFPHPRRS